MRLCWLQWQEQGNPMTGERIELLLEFGVILLAPIVHTYYLKKYKNADPSIIQQNIKLFVPLYALVGFGIILLVLKWLAYEICVFTTDSDFIISTVEWVMLLLNSECKQKESLLRHRQESRVILLFDQRVWYDKYVFGTSEASVQLLLQYQFNWHKELLLSNESITRSWTLTSSNSSLQAICECRRFINL